MSQSIFRSFYYSPVCCQIFLTLRSKIFITDIKKKKGVDKNGTIPDDLESIHGRIHYALKNVLPVVPSGEEELIKILSRNFPYKNDSLVVHITYLKNVLQMLEYLPSLQSQVLEIIFERLTDLDVNKSSLLKIIVQKNFFFPIVA